MAEDKPEPGNPDDLSPDPGSGEPSPEDSPAEEPAIDFEALVESIRESDDRYRVEAFYFVREALDFCLARLGERRHISGGELLTGVRQMALERFGPMARTVLNHWGLQAGEDVGQIVFLLVEAGVMSKTDKDSLDDFSGIMTFDEGFESEYRW